MSQRANVTSVEAIEAFRANLIVYLSKARPTLEEISDQLLRLRQWVQTDQRAILERALQRRMRELEDARATLLSSRLSSLKEAGSVELMAVQRAKSAMDAATEKMRVLKQWNRNLDSRVEPLVRQLEKLHTVLVNEMPKAIAYLNERINALDAYANTQVGTVESAPATAATEASQANADAGSKGKSP